MHVDPKDISHLVVLAHPVEESFNRSVAAEYCDAVADCGQTAILRDLYVMDFDPRLRRWRPRIRRNRGIARR